MKTHVMPILVSILSLTAASYADRVMSRTEAVGILQKLAGAPTTTWIAGGTIEATHEEYRAARITDAAAINAEIQRQISEYQANPNKIELTPELQKMALEAIPFNVRYEKGNEYTMTSSVTLKYDGDKFWWSIEVGSRTDSVEVPSDLTGNFVARKFNLNVNGHRIFAWDGQKYTLYMASSNQAIVDAIGMLPRNVNGPLTAGVIPWGTGKLSTTSLNTAAIAASEVYRDGATQTEMTVKTDDGTTMTFTLDPAKDNAVTAYTWRGNLNKTLSNFYSGHQKVGGKWVPMTILLEERDLETNRLLKSDKWQFTRVDAVVPRNFSVAFSAGTRIEYYSPISDTPAVYNYSNMLNIEGLLAEQLAFKATKDQTAQNCATAALKHVAFQLGKSVSDKELAKLVGPDGKTSLYALKQAAQGLGLSARAVKIDLATLRTLGDCKAILHFPGKNHFVALDSIDEQDAWLTDLSSEKFHYRTSADLLPLDWSAGTALLLAAHPIPESSAEMSDKLLRAILGGDGWDCTLLLSGRGAIYCAEYDPPIGCDGYFRWYNCRYSCQEAPSGTCSLQLLPWFIQLPCIPEGEYDCNPEGEWETAEIMACK